jgi:tetratricopeptide (TPR) repeat protein
MEKFWKKFAIAQILLGAWLPIHAQRLPSSLSPREVKFLEDGLANDPDDLSARRKLIAYYFESMVASKSQDFEENREQHIFWLIEHHPDDEFAGSPEAQIMPGGFLGSLSAYQKGKEKWLQQLELHPDDPVILRNAASFLALFDGSIARQFLEKSYLTNPEDRETIDSLARSYEQERMTAHSPEKQAELSQKAFVIRERGAEKLQGEERFYALNDLTSSALEAGDIAKAEQYAEEILHGAPSYKNDWNYGNAIHKGNIILGRIALQRGDIAGAKSHLLAAGETPGSPQLDSFGPNMVLARDLLKKGERETVLSYLQACTKFWKMGGDTLSGWIATIKGGGIPDFSANLFY